MSDGAGDDLMGIQFDFGGMAGDAKSADDSVPSGDDVPADGGDGQKAGSPAEGLGQAGTDTDAERAPGEQDAKVAEGARPASERIAELFLHMQRQHSLLFDILGYCCEPRTLDQIEDRTRRLRENHRSVFSTASVCAQLEKAGALTRVLEDGSPYDEAAAGQAKEAKEDASAPGGASADAGGQAAESEIGTAGQAIAADRETPAEGVPESGIAGEGMPQAQTVIVDGVTYLKQPEPPRIFWLATKDGLAALDQYDPLSALRSLLAQDAAYLPIYRTVLEMCAVEGGAKMGELSSAIDSDPLCQNPRFYAAHFVNNLEACDAVAWESGWVTTEAGLQGLELIQADDAPASKEGR